nr:hypothetical protein [uncultured Enterobacter sp.]
MTTLFSNVTFLSVSLRNKTTAGQVYANGRNEVELMVNVIVTDSQYNQIFLDNGQLNDALSVCDYYTREPLDNTGWHNGAGSGEFISDGMILGHSSINNSQEISAPQLSAMPGYMTPQCFIMRISADSKAYSAKSLAVKLFDGESTTYDTALGGGFDSYVSLSPLVEKVYTTDDMTLYKGAFSEKVTNTVSPVNKFSLFYAFKNKQLVVFKTSSNNASIPLDNQQFCERIYAEHLTVLYMDGQEAGKTMDYVAPNGTVCNFTINERPGQQCFTNISTEKEGSTKSVGKYTLEIYDQYGNNGTFQVTAKADYLPVIVITD